MKRLIIVLALLIVSALPATAGTLGVLGSGWFPQDAEDDIGAGFLADFGIGKNWDVEMRVFFHDRMSVVAGPREFELRATPIEAGVAYNILPGNFFNPYIGGGVGYHVLDAQKLPNGRVENEWGWYGVLGLQIQFSERGAGILEVEYRQLDATLKGDDLGFNGIENGFSLDGAVFNFGIAMTF